MFLGPILDMVERPYGLYESVKEEDNLCLVMDKKSAWIPT
jgi:hypothetical protein